MIVKRIILFISVLLFFAMNDAIAQTTKTVGGAGADYATLKLAFDAINAGNIAGTITLQITGTNSLTAPAVLNASGTGGASYASVSIYPTITGITMSGNLAAPLIDLNGADNVTIDGRVNATGTVKDMVIINTSTSNTAGTSTIRLINSAENNTIKYCTLKGAETNATSGILLFSTAIAGNGNDGNTIDNNNITNAAGNRPLNAIYSLGSSGYENSGNTISNNAVYDFLNIGKVSNGIYLAGNTTAWTLTGNSFYETGTLAPTADIAYRALLFVNTSGTGFIITGNFFGGQEAQCGGSAWAKTSTKDNIFIAVSLSVGTGTASTIQNNTIKNFAWANSKAASWTGIDIVAGDVNIGTVNGNTIGAATGTGSITVSSGTNAAEVYGINIASTGTVVCQNNVVGSMTTSNSNTDFATNLYGINKTAGAGITTISNNTIGSAATANSIQASSGSTKNAQTVYGIYSAGTGTITISGNTLANLTNSITNTSNDAGLINGIASISGTNIISNNSIRGLTIANGSNKADHKASIGGIVLTGTTLKTVTGNTIYNLSNTCATFTGSVYGLYYTAATGANIVSGNFIHSLSVTGASSTTAEIYGIKIIAGAATYFNNIISLGGNTKTTLFGIYETGAANNNNNLYFNTVYIVGSLASGTVNKSYALYSALKTNLRNFRNNIFVNARSTISGVSLHYAAYFNYNAATLLTLNYNCYYASGTGGVLGYYDGANKTSLPLIPGMDASSLAIDPVFTNPGGTSAPNYIPASLLAGIAIGTITTDFSGSARAATPTMGAWERNSINKWKGTVSNNWNTASNWTWKALPAIDDNITFDDAPLNHCQLDQNRSVTSIINAQSTYRMVTNGFKITVKGSLTLTNSAQIDASAISSAIEFAGVTTQTIPAGVFYNNQVYNLTVNNANNVVLFGTLNLLSSLTAASGRLDAFTNSPTVIYAGGSAQIIGNSLYLSNQVYNLTIDNTSGVTLNSDLSINNDLVINSGKSFVLSAGKTLTVSGAITNAAGNAGFVLQSDATGTASLLNNTVDVPATVKRYISGSAEAWHFISSPVADQAISGSWLPSGTYGNGTGYDLYLWNEANNCWIYKLNTTSDINWSTVHPSPDFVVGRGYLYSFQAANPTKEFAGNLNTGTVSYGLTASSDSLQLKGFNLVGNPYPSSMDWLAPSGWNRSVLTDAGGGYDMWIWNPAANNYGVFNSASGAGTNSVTRYIAPMQGFFVRAASAGSLSADNAVRVHAGAGDWKNAVVTSVQISLSVRSGTDTSFDEVRVLFGYPPDQHGSAKIFSHMAAAPSLYLPAEDGSLSIRYLTDTAEYPAVPVSFKSGTDGSYLLKGNFDPAQFETVILEDRQVHQFQNLKFAGTYDFQSSASDGTNRFLLHFRPVDDTGNNDLPARIYTAGGRLMIDLALISKETELSVCDVLGRKLLQKTLQGETQHTLYLTVDADIMIVTLINPDGRLSKKILWLY